MYILALLLAFVTLPGCMIVREGKVKPPTPWPPAQTQDKKSLAISVAGVQNPKGAHQAPRVDVIDAAREQALKAYSESGLFSSVVLSDEPTDLRADIGVIEDGTEGMGFSGYLSALTFTLVPGYVSEKVLVRTSVSDRTKRVVGMVEKEEQQGFWIQFFLLFTMPFTSSSNDVAESLFYDVHRSTIDEAHSKGLF